MAVQVMFMLSAEDAVILSVDMRMSCASSSNITGVIRITALFFNSVPLVFHTKVFAMAVHVNSVTPLSETLTDCGGNVISVI